ncbi:MAG: hypothetical protein Q9212_001155 [Teloschistes hypoglaucus]
MSYKPIFVATHPRACSTAFERVFMTQRDTLQCFHEPFGDAFYYGSERLSTRYEHDQEARDRSGLSKSTYQAILDRFVQEGAEHEGKRLFIKDMAYYLVPPNGNPASIAPSLGRVKRGVGTTQAPINGATNGTTQAPYPYATDTEPNNPTVIPRDILGRFHFTFLIRHPRWSVPSYYRCTVPPLDAITGFSKYMPSEAGYNELRRVFDYLQSVGQIGPRSPGQDSEVHPSNAEVTEGVEVCVIDADDLLDNPGGILQAYCKSVGIKYDPDMLKWETEEDHNQAVQAFEKWTGFHEDVINSKDLKPRLHKNKIMSVQDEDTEWVEKFGEKGAQVIRETIDANVKDYEYLKKFAIKA